MDVEVGRPKVGGGPPSWLYMNHLRGGAGPPPSPFDYCERIR